MAKILIVDDSPGTIKMVTMALEEGGHEVASCDSPAGLPAVIKREAPDLILLDVVMPTMHGDKALQALSSRGWDSQAKVLFYSSRPREELEQLVTASGADGYIAKDIGFAAMVETVNEWLTR